MPTLYEYYITGDNENHLVRGASWFAQTFTPSIAHTITSVKLRLRKYGSPTGSATISIRATDADSKPTGSDLASGTIALADIAVTPPAWYEITLGAGTTLSASTKYAIVVRYPDGDTNNFLIWRVDDALSLYGGGGRVTSTDSGVTWGAESSAADMLFEDWGGPSVTFIPKIFYF